MGADLADAVDGAVVETGVAVRLALQADTDVFDGAGEGGVGDSGKGSGEEVLAVGEVGARVAVRQVTGFEPAAGGVEGAELDGDAGADADEGGEGALVEGGGAFVLVDGGCGVEGAGVLGGGLEADLDDVEGLTWSISAMPQRYSAHKLRESKTYQSILEQLLQQLQRTDPWPSGDRPLEGQCRQLERPWWDEIGTVRAN